MVHTFNVASPVLARILRVDGQNDSDGKEFGMPSACDDSSRQARCATSLKVVLGSDSRCSQCLLNVFGFDVLRLTGSTNKACSQCCGGALGAVADAGGAGFLAYESDRCCGMPSSAGDEVTTCNNNCYSLCIIVVGVWWYAVRWCLIILQERIPRHQSPIFDSFKKQPRVQRCSYSASSLVFTFGTTEDMSSGQDCEHGMLYCLCKSTLSIQTTGFSCT